MAGDERHPRRDETVPPTAPTTDAELAEAAAFANLVDSLVLGDGSPGPLSAEQRDMVDVATMIHGAEHPRALADDRVASLIDRAMIAAVGAAVGAPAEAEPLVADAPATAPPISDIERARLRSRARLRHATPWTVAAVAVAAAVALAVLGPIRGRDGSSAAPPVAELPASQRSRPADRVVGRIERVDAARASSRIDLIYADRLAGYRSLQLRGSGDTP